MTGIQAIFATLLLAGTPTASPGAPGGILPAPEPASIFEAIERRYDSGSLDDRTRHLYRVAAVRRPEILPAELRTLSRVEPDPTRIMVDALQWVARTGGWGGEVHRLLQPPPDLEYHIDSTKWPLRVSYSRPDQGEYAQAVLDAAEYSYDVQVVEWGFWQPPIEPGTEPYRIYIGDAGSGAAGYTAPYDENPDTNWADCYSYIVIDENLYNPSTPLEDRYKYAASTVAHEVNHSMQAAMDCSERTTYWENTATYIEAWTLLYSAGWNYAMMRYFQSKPWRALDYFETGGGYQYGGALWNYFLADAVVPDPEEGPVMVREIWEASVQRGWINEPDYYDAIETVAEERGAGLTRMTDLYTEFAEARYFVGTDDDGVHIRDASAFADAEVALVAEHDVYELPVRDAVPETSYRPAPFGSNHVRVNLGTGYSHPLKVEFMGDDQTRWAVRAVLIGGPEGTRSEAVPLDQDRWEGSLTVDPAGAKALLLVVANLGVVGYDPDDQSWPLGTYSYRIEPVVGPPVIGGVLPGAVVRGQQNLHLRLVGENFVYGPEFTLGFTDPLIQLVSIDAMTETEVLFTVTVPQSTNLGWHNMTVVNAGGESATAEDALAVVDRLGVEPPEPDGGCHTAGGTGCSLSLVLGLLLACFLRRRRSR